MTAAAAHPALALEQRGFNGWPALATVFLGDWLGRLSGGFTKRANSVNAARADAVLDDATLRAAQGLYRHHGLPCVFRISPLAAPQADRLLDEAGYRLAEPSWVACAPLQESVPSLPDLEVATAADAAWLDGFAHANGVAPAARGLHDAMLRAIAWPCGYATLRHRGEAVGFALAVLEGGWVGCYDVVIVPAHRGHGHGRRLMQGLLAWARTQGAARAQLQVRGDNAAARGLYASLGFQDAYRYHYRLPPAGHSPGRTPDT